MVWATKAALSATELANRAADLPLIIGRNWLRSLAVGFPSIKWTADGSHASTDLTVTDFETIHAADDFDHLTTKPTAGTDRYLNIDLGTTDTEIDCLVIKNHNAFSVGADIYVQIATDAAFTTPLIIATHPAPANNKRIVLLDLREGGDSSPQRFTGVRYMRIFFDMPVSNAPAVGEVVVGRSRQLVARSLFPYAPGRKYSEQGVSETHTGIVAATPRLKNRRRLVFSYLVKDDDAVADWEALFEDDTDGGTLPFWFIEEPTTAPSDAVWFFPELFDLEGEDTGYGERRFRLLGKEQGPNFLSAGV